MKSVIVRRMVSPLIMVACLLMAGWVQAKTLSVAVVDPLAALSDTDQAKAMMEKYSKAMEADRQEVRRLEDEIRGLREKRKKDADIMSAAQVESLSKKVEDKKMEYEYVGKKLQKKQKEGQGEILKLLGPKFEAAMNQIVEEGKYDLIIHKQAIFYSSPTVDITEAVTKKINAMK